MCRLYTVKFEYNNLIRTNGQRYTYPDNFSKYVKGGVTKTCPAFNRSLVCYPPYFFHNVFIFPHILRYYLLHREIRPLKWYRGNH